VIRRLRTDLVQVAQLATPRTIRALWGAGVLDPPGAAGLAASWPWFLGRGPSLGIVSRINRVAVGNKPAVIDRAGPLPWRELDGRADRLAVGLSSLGLRGGDRVAFLLRNGREMAEGVIAAQKRGLVACPLNTWAKPGELRATVEEAEPTALIYDVLHAEQVERLGHQGLILIAVGDQDRAVEGSLGYEGLLEAQPGRALSPITRDRGNPRIIIHTSGTTGTPKGAARDPAVTGVREFTGLLELVPFRRSDVILCPAPMFHSFGLLTLTVGSLLGATLVLPEKFDPERCLELIEEHRVTAAAMVPVMIGRILDLPEEVRSRYDTTTLRILLASGSAISPEVRADVREAFGDVLYDLYGSTEAGWVAIATPEDQRQRPDTVGKPVSGVEVAVFSVEEGEEGKRLPGGESGELHVKSSSLFEGYTSGESRPRRDGFMSIGDIGHLDEDGYLYVEGRADDMVVVGGENVYPTEIEATIRDIAGVEDVAVAGAPDRELGQVVVAFVVGDVDPEEIVRTCKEDLASFKVPRRVETVDELPRTSTGKVRTRELVEGLTGSNGGE
jgi:acyl-CoA synthetase (AMP-forming)/AMP-acid ligase II